MYTKSGKNILTPTNIVDYKNIILNKTPSFSPSKKSIKLKFAIAPSFIIYKR